MTDKELMESARKYGEQALMSRKKFAALLPEIYKRKLYQQKFHSIYEFAARLAGMSASHVEEVIKLHEKLSDKPKLQALIPIEGWSKVRVVANVATKQNQGQLPKKAVEIYVRNRFSPGRELAKKKVELSRKSEVIFMKLKAVLEAQSKSKLTDSRAMEILLEKLEKPVKPRKVKQSKPGRHLPAARRREVIGDGYCSIYSCKRLAKEIHHPERYSLVKNHQKLVALCHEHHQITHAGLIANEFDSPGRWKLRYEPKPNQVDLMYLEKLHCD